MIFYYGDFCFAKTCFPGFRYRSSRFPRFSQSSGRFAPLQSLSRFKVKRGTKRWGKKGTDLGCMLWIEQGMEQGIQMGILQEKKNSVRKMLKSGCKETFIAECLELPVETVRQWAAEN